MNFVVLCSSRGTTFQSVLDAIKNGSLTARCLGLITDNSDRECIAKAKTAGLPVKIVEPRSGESREEYDRRLHKSITKLLQNHICPPFETHFSDPPCHPEGSDKDRLEGRHGGSEKCPQGDVCDSLTFLVALGWMHILSPWFIRKWPKQIINIHPALLPKYGGKGMYGDRVHEAVLEAGEKETGITIHFMDEGVDTGPIIVQKKCSVFSNDTTDKIKSRVQELEKEWMPKILQNIQEEKHTTHKNMSS